VLVVVLLVAVEDGAAMSRSVKLREDRRRAGENVVIIEPTIGGDQRVISVPECVALAVHPYVSSAGALLSSDFVHLPNLPHHLYRRVTVTGGAVEVIVGREAGTNGSEVLVSDVLAEQFGLAEDSILGSQLDGREPAYDTVRGVLELDGRLSELGRAALIVGPPLGWTNQCLVEVRDEFRSAARDGELLAAFSARPRTITVRSLRPGSGQASPLEVYEQRAARFLWAPAALIVATMWLAVLTSRRAELGLYASYLVRRPQGVTLMMIQFALTALPAVGAAILVALCVTVANDFGSLATTAMLRAIWRVTAAATLACGVASWLAFRGRIADQLKDR
jgi:hypothetical protein